MEDRYGSCFCLTAASCCAALFGHRVLVGRHRRTRLQVYALYRDQRRRPESSYLPATPAPVIGTNRRRHGPKALQDKPSTFSALDGPAAKGG